MFGIYPPIELILSWSEQAREKFQRERRQREQRVEEERARRNRRQFRTPRSEDHAQNPAERKVS